MIQKDFFLNNKFNHRYILSSNIVIQFSKDVQYVIFNVSYEIIFAKNLMRHIYVKDSQKCNKNGLICCLSLCYISWPALNTISCQEYEFLVKKD